jgi:hypothetical protein
MLLLHQSACKIVFLYHINPVQVSHLLLPITKRVHCFYANRALKNFIINLKKVLKSLKV